MYRRRGRARLRKGRHVLARQPARIIGSGLSSRRSGSKAGPSASRVSVPSRVLSPGCPKITSAPPSFAPYLNGAIPLHRSILLPSASLNSSLPRSGLIPSLRRMGAGTTEYIAPESTRNSTFTAEQGLARLATSSSRTVIPPEQMWSGRPGSNRRRPAWEAGILPLNYARSNRSLRYPAIAIQTRRCPQRPLPEHAQSSSSEPPESSPPAPPRSPPRSNSSIAWSNSGPLKSSPAS